MTKRDDTPSNPNATTRVTRPSGDRNATEPVFGDRDKPDDIRRKKQDDLQRQARGTGVDLPGKRVP